MILYHFTRKANVKSILKHGLIPAYRAGLDPDATLTHGRAFVWLTADETLEPSDRGKRMVCERRPDRFPDPKANFYDPNSARIVVRIRKNDPRLIGYLPWARLNKLCFAKDPLQKELAKDHWLYAGSITPDKLSVDPQVMAA